jgi:hypothetical protein
MRSTNKETGIIFVLSVQMITVDSTVHQNMSTKYIYTHEILHSEPSKSLSAVHSPMQQSPAQPGHMATSQLIANTNNNNKGKRLKIAYIRSNHHIFVYTQF